MQTETENAGHRQMCAVQLVPSNGMWCDPVHILRLSRRGTGPWNSVKRVTNKCAIAPDRPAMRMAPKGQVRLDCHGLGRRSHAQWARQRNVPWFLPPTDVGAFHFWG